MLDCDNVTSSLVVKKVVDNLRWLLVVLGDKGEDLDLDGPELLDVAGMEWNSAKKTVIKNKMQKVIELKENRAKKASFG